ncbi:hypothetical protein N658DRAFT_211868 [Parathielavia hyrcaniae]|uniref:Uncharacterized protein n=1 Tax=Parathielavia hyrcaniae TaxID=113614 RepID=A0AAN6PY81_9PEZI|nr:hypothetical protein N658DRAFT_211868 [Parathielavia hyrcaniae]
MVFTRAVARGLGTRTTISLRKRKHGGDTCGGGCLRGLVVRSPPLRTLVCEREMDAMERRIAWGEISCGDGGYGRAQSVLHTAFSVSRHLRPSICPVPSTTTPYIIAPCRGCGIGVGSFLLALFSSDNLVGVLSYRDTPRNPGGKPLVAQRQ